MGTKLRYLLLPFAVILAFNVSLAQSTITGTLTYHETWPMSGCTMYLMDANYTIIDSSITDGGGQYVFYNVVPGDYYITGTTSMSPGGVDLADAYLLMMYLFNYYSFTPMQELAADVDGSGTIDWTDYFTIVNGWITMGYPFPAGDWVFDTTLVTVTAGRDNTSSNSQGSVTGDMNSSLEPDKILSDQNIFFANISEDVGENSALWYPLTIESAEIIRGFHLDLELPEGVIFRGCKAEIDIASNQQGNRLKLTWMNEDLDLEYDQFDITLIFHLDASKPIDDHFALDLNRNSHFVDNEGNLFHNLSITMASVHITDPINSGAKSLGNVQNYPNPFVTETTFSFTLASPGTVEVAVFSHTGQLAAHLSEGILSEGPHTITHNFSGLPAGIYSYRLIYKGEGKDIQSGSMIKLR